MKEKQIELYDPFPHQLYVHNLITEHLEAHPVGDADRQIIFNVNAMRQVGKTTLVGNELNRFGFEMPDAESIYISPTFELARKMLNDFSSTFGNSPLVRSINKSERTIRYCTGHLVSLLSSEQGDAIRGKNVSGLLVLDEVAYMRREFIDEVVSPFTDFHKAPTIEISTPRTKRGIHYEHQCLGRIAGSGVISIDWAKFDMSYLHTAEFLARKRELLPERTFRTDYLGEFIDSESTVFGDMKPVLLGKGIVPRYTQLCWGIDWATGASKDRTVLTAFNENNEQVFLKLWASEAPMKQVAEIAAILNAHKDTTQRVVAEKNSIGAIYLDALRELLDGIQVIEFVTTNESKRRIIDALQVMIEKKQIMLLNDETQLAEFEFFEMHQLASGVITYSAPTSLHDDHVMAVAIAFSGRNVVNRFF